MDSKTRRQWIFFSMNNLQALVASGWTLRVGKEFGGKFRASIYLRHTLDAHNCIGATIAEALKLLDVYVQSPSAIEYEARIGYPRRAADSAPASNVPQSHD